MLTDYLIDILNEAERQLPHSNLQVRRKLDYARFILESITDEQLHNIHWDNEDFKILN